MDAESYLAQERERIRRRIQRYEGEVRRLEVRLEHYRRALDEEIARLEEAEC